MDATETILCIEVLAPGGNERVGSELVALLDELAHGMIVVGFERRLLHANQSALRELESSRILSLRGRELLAIDEADGNLLNQAIAGAKLGKRCLITLGNPAEGAALALTVLPLKADPAAARPSCAALIFARAALCDPLMLASFSRKHSLTGAEEQVLGFLCEGHSAPEIALHLKVAVSTVRSHVRSVCAKTGSSGVRELVNRVAVLPPLAPVIWGKLVH